MRWPPRSSPGLLRGAEKAPGLRRASSGPDAWPPNATRRIRSNPTWAAKAAFSAVGVRSITQAQAKDGLGQRPGHMLENPMHLACLHAKPNTIPVFEARCPPGIHLTHHLQRATPTDIGPHRATAAAAEMQALLSRMAVGVDAVLVTCPRLHPMTPPSAWSAMGLARARLQEIGAGQRIDIFALTADMSALCSAALGPPPADATYAFTTVAPEHGIATPAPVLVDALEKAVAASPADLILIAANALDTVTPNDARIITLAEIVFSQILRNRRTP